MKLLFWNYARQSEARVPLRAPCAREPVILALLKHFENTREQDPVAPEARQREVSNGTRRIPVNIRRDASAKFSLIYLSRHGSRFAIASRTRAFADLHSLRRSPDFRAAAHRPFRRRRLIGANVSDVGGFHQKFWSFIVSACFLFGSRK